MRCVGNGLLVKVSVVPGGLLWLFAGGWDWTHETYGLTHLVAEGLAGGPLRVANIEMPQDTITRDDLICHRKWEEGWRGVRWANS